MVCQRYLCAFDIGIDGEKCFYFIFLDVLRKCHQIGKQIIWNKLLNIYWRIPEKLVTKFISENTMDWRTVCNNYSNKQCEFFVF